MTELYFRPERETFSVWADGGGFRDRVARLLPCKETTYQHLHVLTLKSEFID